MQMTEVKGRAVKIVERPTSRSRTFAADNLRLLVGGLCLDTGFRLALEF